MNTSNNHDAMQFTYANIAIGVTMTISWNADTSAVSVTINGPDGSLLDQSEGSIKTQDGQNILVLSGVDGVEDKLMGDLTKAYYCIDSMMDWMSKMNITSIQTGESMVMYKHVSGGIQATLVSEHGTKKMLVLSRNGELNLIDSEGRKTPVTEETIATATDEAPSEEAPLTIDGLIKKINSVVAELIVDHSEVHQAQNTVTIDKLNRLALILKTSTPDQIDLDVFIKAAGDLGVRVS